MKNTLTGVVTFLTTVVLVGSFNIPHSHALGIRIADQDAKATARGNAFAATADNPSAIYYNPAGITQLEGHNFRLGGYLTAPRFDYTSPTGRNVDANDKEFIVPQFYYTYNHPNSMISLGLGVYSPYGLGTEWPDSSGFRTITTKADLQYITINPVVALQLHRTFSIAAGLAVNYGDLDMTRGIAAPGDEFRFNGDDWALGFNIGLLWQPIEQLSFGINYRSATTMEFDGDSRAKPYTPTESANADFELPQNIVLGVSWRPTKRWNLEANVDWTDWDTLGDVTLNQEFSPDVVMPFNWESSLFYEFGVTHYFDNGINLSAGYIYSENSVPTRDFTPAVPDSDRHILSVGIGYENERFSVDLAYQYSFSSDRVVSGSRSSSLIGESADGTYDYSGNALALSFGLKF